MITLLGLIVLLQLATIVLMQQKEGWLQGKSVATVVVDTCVLIDERLEEIAKTGFLTMNLVVPSCVINELQMMADGSNSEKRERARSGLDTVQDLLDHRKIKLRILDVPTSDLPVDDQLVQLAASKRWSLMTIDYNLIKVAQIAGVETLNINELAQNLRARLLPGETTRLKLQQKGAEKNQAIGYTDDGTMVVVDNAGRYVGKTTDVEIIRGIQTASGKMYFAKRLTGKN